MMGQIWRRLQLLAAQGKATLVGAQTVQVQVLDGETLKAQRIEPYGLSYRPKAGAQAYLVFPGGDRALGLALVVGDKRYQLELVEGEVALHDDEGNFVKLGRGGLATVKAASKVIADTPEFETTGNAVIGGNLKVVGVATLSGGAAINGALTNNGTSVGSGHRHSGVLTGNGNSGGVIG
jgi:phage baseplate assembly protein V